MARSEVTLGGLYSKIFGTSMEENIFAGILAPSLNYCLIYQACQRLLPFDLASITSSFNYV